MSTYIKKGYKPWNKGMKGLILNRIFFDNNPARKGKGSCADISYENRSNENNFKWKGNNVGYRALHSWIMRKLGKPTKCEFCGKEKTTPKSIHWANKSRQYLRELSDWIMLCVKCHKAYDRAEI